MSASSITETKGHDVKIAIIGGSDLVASILVERLRNDEHGPPPESPGSSVGPLTGEADPLALDHYSPIAISPTTYSSFVEDPLALDPLSPDPLSPIETRPIGDTYSPADEGDS